MNLHINKEALKTSVIIIFAVIIIVFTVMIVSDKLKDKYQDEFDNGFKEGYLNAKDDIVKGFMSTLMVCQVSTLQYYNITKSYIATDCLQQR